VVAPLSSLLLLLLVPAAAAASPSSTASPASGSLAVTITASTPPTPSGNNTDIYNLEADTYNGTLSGTSVGSGPAVIHSDGSANARSVKTFTGTIAGSAPGTLTTYTTCGGTMASITCVFVMDHGTGGLAGVYVEGTQTGAFTGPNTVAFTYNALVWSTAHHKWSTEMTQGTPDQATSASDTSSAAAAHHGWWSRATISVAGNATLTNTTTTHDYDGNTIVYFIFAASRTGDMVGPAVGSGMLTIHSDGTANGMDTGTFTGTLLGSAPGTIQFAGRQSGNTTHLAGHIVLFHGTGGLAGIRGYGPETVNPATGVFTDTIRIWSSR
jgi:hypothetical protein